MIVGKTSVSSSRAPRSSASCGAIQIVLGLLKAGRLTDFFPLSVVHGMLAGIGVIIIVKQIFLALGATAPKVGMIHLIESIPSGFGNFILPIMLGAKDLGCFGKYRCCANLCEQVRAVS